MHINRRTFARLSLASGLAALLGACRGKEEVPAPPAPPTLPVEAQPTGTVGPARYQEAPMLAEQVARGELPPVAERLPTKPLVLEPNASLGQYGGGLRSAMYTGPACLDVNVGIGMLLNFVLTSLLVAFG